MSVGMFSRSRRRLTLFYAGVMCLFLVVLIFVVQKTMEWSLTSEQSNELMDTATSIVDAQHYANQHTDSSLNDDNNFYRNINERLFFYVFDADGKLLNFSRASFRIEPFILDVIAEWDAPDGDVKVYGKTAENGRETKVMMTARIVYQAGNDPQTVYVGKDVTAMYYGLQKATYALIFLGILALIAASVIGFFMSGKAMVPLKEAYERQRQFAADASHELRTPLAVVMASADLLDNAPGINDPFLKQVIADVRDEVKKMSRLVGDLLVVARSDNKALKLNRTNFDLADVLEQTVRMITPIAEKKNIAVTVDKGAADEGAATKVFVYADEQRIRQLVMILTDNAVKYTPQNGKVTLGIDRTHKDDNKIGFFVADTGIGIADEDKERIFDRFFRVDKARSRAMGGNGLGLAIAQEIVNLHDGQIAVESKLAGGTKFIVELPAD